MNSGLVGLMMQLLHTDNSEKNRIAAEKRQAEREAFSDKQRASLWQHQEASRIKEKSADRDYEVNNEHRKEAEKNAHVSVMATLAKTGVPFNQLNVEHQTEMSGPFNGDLSKTAQVYTSLLQDLATATTTADVAKAKADASKAMNDTIIAEAIRPGLARNSEMKQALDTATSIGGGATPAAAASHINRVALSADGTQHVFRNKSYTTPEQLNTEAAMASAKAMASKSNADKNASIGGFGKTATDDIDASGNPVVKVGNTYTVAPVAAPTIAVRQPLTNFERNYQHETDIMSGVPNYPANDKSLISPVEQAEFNPTNKIPDDNEQRMDMIKRLMEKYPNVDISNLLNK